MSSDDLKFAGMKALFLAQQTSVAFEFELNPFRWGISYLKQRGFYAADFGPLTISVSLPP